MRQVSVYVVDANNRQNNRRLTKLGTGTSFGPDSNIGGLGFIVTVYARQPNAVAKGAMRWLSGAPAVFYLSRDNLLTIGKSMTSHTSTSRDLVMTFIHRADFNYIAPFVLSLKKSGFRGSTVMFASHLDKRSIEQLRDSGVRVVPFHFSGEKSRQPLSRPWPIWRWFFSTGAPRWAKIRLAHAVFHLYYRKCLLYSEFLERHLTDFDRVLLTDGKDVFFQADPFAWNWTPGVHFVLEAAGHLMGNCPVHRECFHRLFGPSFLKPHAQKVPACSGTTFGDMAGIRHYLDLMIHVTMQARELEKLWCGDQGVHNYILLQNLMSNITVHENRRGPVLTMREMKEWDLQLNAQGAVLNEDGTVVPVLHQYQFFPAIKESLVSSLQTAGQIAASETVLPAIRSGDGGGTPENIQALSPQN
jgi:hypothetical protein